MKRLLRFIFIMRYGVRGGLRPPLGLVAWRNYSIWTRLWYWWRWSCWRIDNSLYSWCGVTGLWWRSIE